MTLRELITGTNPAIGWRLLWVYDGSGRWIEGKEIQSKDFSYEEIRQRQELLDAEVREVLSYSVHKKSGLVVRYKVHLIGLEGVKA